MNTEFITDLTKQIWQLNGVNLLVVACAGLAFIIFRLPRVPNYVIPFITCGLSIWLAPDFSDSSIISQANNPLRVQQAHGFLAGLLAWVIGVFLVPPAFDFWKDKILAKFTGGSVPKDEPPTTK